MSAGALGRRAIAPAAVVGVVAAALLVGHGGDGGVGNGVGNGDAAGRSADASPGAAGTRLVTAEEFCDGFGRLAAAQETHLRAASPEAVVALKTAARDVADLAPGTDMVAEARAGLDYLVGALTGLPDDATAQDVVESDDAATLADESHARALAGYIAENCSRSPSEAR